VRAVKVGSVGYNRSGRDSVTPPPETEMVTSVGAETAVVVMSNRPIPLPAAIVAELGTLASAGLLLVTWTS